MVKRICLFALLLGITIPKLASGAALRIRVVDESGHPIWARLEVRGRDGKMYHPVQAIMDVTAGLHGALPFYLGSFVIRDECQLQVPPGHYRIIGEHGLEYERAEKSIVVSGQGVTGVTLRLRPWIRMWKQGWWSGDLHVHRPWDQARDLILAEDLNFCPVITTWPDGKVEEPLARSLWDSDFMPVIKIDARHFLTLRNAEDERGGGAWIFLMLRKPLLGLDTVTRWYPPGLTFVREACEERTPGDLFPWVDCEKPFWWEVPVVMALATPDSLEVLCNQFMEYGIQDSEAWGRERNKDEFPGQQGWVKYMLSLYYHFLNLGFHLPASAGTASGILPNPIGYNRVYVHFSGPFSVAKWFTALHEGKSFATNGPMLFFNVNAEKPLVKGTVEARAREPLDRIEIVANGNIIHWFPVPPGTLRYQAEFTFDPKDYSWVSARCFLRTGGTIRLAQTSPIYLKGHWDCRSDAQYFVNWINDLISRTRANPERFRSAEEEEQVLRTYGQALSFYEEKLQQGCQVN